MPLIGFSVLQTRTAIFLHATIGQLFYAYPARRINAPPQFNGALHLAVILGVGLQLLTVLLPSLRTLLGLEPLTLELLTLVSAAVLMTWARLKPTAASRFGSSHSGRSDLIYGFRFLISECGNGNHHCGKRNFLIAT